MITVLNIQRLTQGKSMRLELLADSKEDTLPTKVAEIDGLSGAEAVEKGSTCMTVDGDICIMGNDGRWGGWI